MLGPRLCGVTPGRLEGGEGCHHHVTMGRHRGWGCHRHVWARIAVTMDRHRGEGCHHAPMGRLGWAGPGLQIKPITSRGEGCGEVAGVGQPACRHYSMINHMPRGPPGHLPGQNPPVITLLDAAVFP